MKADMCRAKFFPAGLRALLLSAAALCCAAQQPAASKAAGLEMPWDVRSILASLNKDTEELKPLLNSMDPQQWADKKGAPTTYLLQFQTALRQLNDISIVTKLLAQKTESLSLALDDYFRFEALDVTMRSIEEGARKYADRGASDKLSRILARNFNNREHFRGYIQDLAVSSEQNFRIADSEAQRCRGIISKEPASSARKYPK